VAEGFWKQIRGGNLACRGSGGKGDSVLLGRSLGKGVEMATAVASSGQKEETDEFKRSKRSAVA
jgi:hypothetical protein